MFKILDYYIWRSILSTITIVLFALVLLSATIKFIDELRKIGQGTYSIMSAGLYVFLSIPKDIEIFSPIAILLGTIMGLNILETNNELLVIQVSGFSKLQIINSVMKFSIPLIILIMVINEWISPICEQIARNYRAKMIYDRTMFSTKNGLWVKDDDDIIFIEQIIGKNQLSGVTIYHFDKKWRLQIIKYATKAAYNNKNWKLLQVNESIFSNEKQILKRNMHSEWKTNLTPDKIQIIMLEPDSLSISKLYKHIAYLKDSNQEFHHYQLVMLRKIFFPFSVMVMILMALSFIFSFFHKISIGQKITIGIILGFIFHVLNQLIGSISLLYNIQPIFGILLLNLVFLIFSMVFLLKCY